MTAGRAADFRHLPHGPRTLGQALRATAGAEELDETMLLIHVPASLESSSWTLQAVVSAVEFPNLLTN